MRRPAVAGLVSLCTLVAALATGAMATAAELPNLVVSSVGLVNAREGDSVLFSATIKNIGAAPTPAGVIHGVRFSVDGVAKTWSDTSVESLAPGATRTLTANGGPSGSSTWGARAGLHTLTAWVDDINRMAEGDDTDNKRNLPIKVAMNPRVFAHWHHSAQRAVSGANTVNAYQDEIRKAKAMGIDAFAYNVINVSLELPEIENLYTAAHLEGDFFLFPEADTCCIPTKDADEVPLTLAQREALLIQMVDELAYFKYNDPARLRVDGGRYGNNLPMMQTWHGANWGTTFWKARQDAWNAAGKPQFFIPYFHPTNISVGTLFDNWDGSAPGQADDLVDGFHNFSGWASPTSPHTATLLNSQYDDAAELRPGMDAMFGCAPVFNRHSGPSLEKFENRIIGDFEGFTAWMSCLQGLVDENPRFIEFATWNDYLEGSYLGGPYTREALWPNYRGNEFSHDAFREIGAYYLEWFKTGRQPDVTTDLIAIAHRPHPKCAPGPHPGADGSATCETAANDTDNAQDRPHPYTPESTVTRPLLRQQDAMSVDDMLYAAVMLKSPGRLTLTSGATTGSFDLPAGVHQRSMPFSVGTQSIKLERNAAPVASATSAVPIVAAPNLFNYNVATAHARTQPPPAPAGTVSDFNGDARTDLSVFRPATGAWLVRNEPTVFLGANGDVPAPCDYSADGTIDEAVFRPGVGAWYIVGRDPVYFGLPGDVPVPADYNGDGGCDVAVFRPSVGAWYIMGQPTVFFGLNGDTPVPGDVDANGTADVAVYRPSVGGWYRIGAPTTFFGLRGDVPVPADYDGDKSADVAIFRPSVGGWYVQGEGPRFLGLTGDVPQPGDYDGNGVSDLAIYRPSSGTWYVAGQAPVVFGATGDLPLPLPSAIRSTAMP